MDLPTEFPAVLTDPYDMYVRVDSHGRLPVRTDFQTAIAVR